MFRKTAFTIDDTGVNFEGYTKGQLWNGWECPYFTKEQGMKIVEAYCKSDCPISFDEQRDAFTYVRTDDKELEIFRGIDCTVNGEKLHLYPIGAWCWIWDEVEAEEDEE